MADFLDLLTSGAESAGDPLAQNPRSSASGSYQFLDSTWRALGNPGRASDAPPEIQRVQAAKLAAQNAATLQRWGIPLTDQTQYLAWQQGAGGARALLANPDDTAIGALVKAGVNPRQAEQAVLLNGGTRDMSAAEFAQRVEHRITGGKMPTGAAATSDPQAGGSDFLSRALAIYSAYPDSPAGKAAKSALDRYQADTKQEDTALDEKGQMLGKEEAAFEKIASDTPPPPQVPKLPDEAAMKAAELAKVSDRPNDPTRVLGQFLPMIAVLGGALGRNGAVNSLKAAAAAMGAAKTNDEDALQRAHQAWQDSMDETIKNFNMQRDAWGDVVSQNKDRRQDLLTQAGIFASQYEIPGLKAAVDSGDLDFISKFQSMQTAAIDPLIKVAEAARADEAAKTAEERISPVDRAYDTAFNDAKASGASDDEATKKAGDAAREVSLDVKPGLEGTQERASKASFEKEPAVQSYQKAQPFFDSIALAQSDPTFGKTVPQQIQILDAFTRIATDGQAIRRFMTQAAQDSFGLVDKAQVAKDQYLAHGAVISQEAIKEYVAAAAEIQSEMQRLYDEKLADDANAMIRQGLDPTNALPTEDLDRLVGEGKIKLPVGGGSSQGQPQPQPASHSQDDIYQTVINARQALRAGKWNKEQVEQALKDYGLDQKHIDAAMEGL